jgi:hypothetical protein
MTFDENRTEDDPLLLNHLENFQLIKEDQIEYSVSAKIATKKYDILIKR